MPLIRVNFRDTGLMLLVLFFGLYFVACAENPPIWHSESTSPDGQWIARARSVRHSGFGTNGIETIVELKRTAGLKETTRILTFANGGESMKLKLLWQSTTHLEVTYADDPATLYFQVLKTSGITISVKDLQQ